MMRAALLSALLILQALAPMVAAAADDDAPTPAYVDYTRPGARDLPIRCLPGDIEYFAGKTLGDVFGAAWPQTPAASHATPAYVVDRVAPTWPKGLGQTGAISVVAVLVGPDGRALDARALCATTPAISKPAVRASMRSRYAPATFDGVAGTSVAIRGISFGVVDPAETPVPDRPAPAGKL